MSDMRNPKIPAHEKWLYENKTALDQVKQGIKDASESKLMSRGSFSKYINKKRS